MAVCLALVYQERGIRKECFQLKTYRQGSLLAKTVLNEAVQKAGQGSARLEHC